MANGSTTLARIQGQGLVETAPVGTAEMASAGFSPAGALQKGLSPDAAKMAGTPPAKVNALRMAMQDVGTGRLSALREMTKTEWAMDKRTGGIAQRAGVLDRFDESMASYITAKLTDAYNNSLLQESNREAKLKQAIFANSPTDRTALVQSVKNIIKGISFTTQADIDLVNRALKDAGAKELDLTGATGAKTNATNIASNLFDALTPQELVDAFNKETKAAYATMNIGDFLGRKEADDFAVNEGLHDGKRDATGEYIGDPAKELETLLKAIVPDPEKLSSMKLGDLTNAIQQWKQQQFQDVAEYEKILASDTSSPAQREFALENLRRLGKVGVIALDETVGNLDAQMRNGDKIQLGDQLFKLEEFFTDPAKLADLKTWITDPTKAPKNLQPWIMDNKDAIQRTIDNLSPDLKDLSDKVVENLKAVQLPPNVTLDSDTIKYYFGDALLKPTLDAKVVPDKYKLLQDPAIGSRVANLLTSLKTIDATIDGRVIFNSLSVDQIKAIAEDVPTYIQNVKFQKQVNDFVSQPVDEATFSGRFRHLLGQIGFKDAGDTLARFMGRTDLQQFEDLIGEAGLRDFFSGGKVNITNVLNEVKKFGGVDSSKLANSITTKQNEIKAAKAATPPDQTKIAALEAELNNLVTTSNNNTNVLINGQTLYDLSEFLNRKFMGGLRRVQANPPALKYTTYDEFFEMGRNLERPTFQGGFDLVGDSLFRSEFEQEVGYHPDAELKFSDTTIRTTNSNFWAEVKNFETLTNSKFIGIQDGVPTFQRGNTTFSGAAVKTKYNEYNNALNNKKNIENNYAKLEKDYSDRVRVYANKIKTNAEAEHNQRMTKWNNFIAVWS